MGKTQTYETALAEYKSGHSLKELAGLLEKPKQPMPPLTLVTHDSCIAIREILQFGGATQEQAEKIEGLWQEIMGAYLTCTESGKRVRAEHSGHYIHLTDPELMVSLL